MSEKKPYEPVVRWIEPGTSKRGQGSLMPSPHRDPTANAAIGKIMYEERRKRRREQNREEQGCAEPYRRRNPHRTRVWRAEEEPTGAAQNPTVPEGTAPKPDADPATPTTAEGGGTG